MLRRNFFQSLLGPNGGIEMNGLALYAEGREEFKEWLERLDYL